MFRKNKSGTTIVPLTGGLGNQLFQIGAALSKYPKSPIILDTVTGNPRLNKSGQVEVIDYRLGAQFQIKRKSRSKMRTKIFGYCLRSSKHPNVIENSKFAQLTIRILSAGALSVFYSRFVRVKTEHNFSSESRWIRDTLLIGYFQNIRWVIESRVVLSKILTPRLDSKEFQSISTTAKGNILVVHLRRGDYRNETTFGLVGSNYYREAFKFFDVQKNVNSVWIFSDDPDEALRIIGPIIPRNVMSRIIPISTLSSVETLELMRLGTYYIISNSTFSWWGAFLSKNDSAVVVAPYPWFKSSTGDKSIYASNWHLLNSEFE